jgi:voltage-gated potassium channel
MWWALVTVTTVGYGDVVPVSTAGRIIASFLLLGGLAFLTVIIAMITGGFVARYQRETSAAGEDHISQGMEHLSLELKELRAEVQALRPNAQR